MLIGLCLKKKNWFYLVSLFIGELFNAKTILVEEQQWYYLTSSFPNGINLKVNVTV